MMKQLVSTFGLIFLFSAIIISYSTGANDKKINQMKEISYLALGDSYTIGESVERDENFPSQLIKKINLSGKFNVSSYEIIARTGWTTADLLGAMKNTKIGENYDIVTLLIGVNNQFQHLDTSQYSKEFKDLLEISVRLAKNNSRHVFVLSIPDYGFTSFGAKNKDVISHEIDLFNSINKRITEKYKIEYINITSISRNEDVTMTASDGLHPSSKQYNLWVEKLNLSVMNNEY